MQHDALNVLAGPLIVYFMRTLCSTQHSISLNTLPSQSDLETLSKTVDNIHGKSEGVLV